MPIDKECLNCGSHFRVPPARAAAKYCSLSCHGVHARSRERRDLTCEGCGTIFNAPDYHGTWPRFCSRECRQADKKRALERECRNCGETFMARSRSNVEDRGFYCSVKCRNLGFRNGEMHQCVACGVEFYRQPNRSDLCCSADCRLTYYKDSRSPAWKGGRYIANGEVMVKLDRPGYAAKYTAEHRVIAGTAIGRLLFRHEVVIRVSGERDDISPDNLYICASISEYAKIRNGSLPWPTKSNLDTYRDRADAVNAQAVAKSSSQRARPRSAKASGPS